MGNYRMTTCLNCDKKFRQYQGEHKTYCSKECRSGSNRTQISKEDREFVMDRDSGICVYCGDNATCIDHVHPCKHGGTSHRSNLVSSCFSCNSVASGNFFQSFDEKQEYILFKRKIGRYAKEEKAPNKPWYKFVYGGARRSPPHH